MQQAIIYRKLKVDDIVHMILINYIVPVPAIIITPLLRWWDLTFVNCFSLKALSHLAYSQGFTIQPSVQLSASSKASIFYFVIQVMFNIWVTLTETCETKY